MGKSVSAQNSAAAANLETLATAYTDRVKDAADKLVNVQSVVKSLDESALELGSQSTAMSTRVAELEAAVKELLPGVGGITKRLSDAEDTVSSLRAEVSKGNLGDTVKTQLRSHFSRATLQIEK